jgi:tRNA-Thr(GGU) m(6)t(6)A37 methyltransferase TsaA
MQPEALTIVPIGTVRSARAEPTDDHWGPVTADIVLDGAVLDPAAVAGLTDFSHLEVVFRFHLCAEEDTVRGARHPRGRTDLPRVGVLAQRVKDRPNHLGVSRCELIGVDGLTLHVRGLDAVDGTPVLDIKPFLTAMVPDRGDVREAGWVEDVMKAYY